MHHLGRHPALRPIGELQPPCPSVYVTSPALLAKAAPFHPASFLVQLHGCCGRRATRFARRGLRSREQRWHHEYEQDTGNSQLCSLRPLLSAWQAVCGGLWSRCRSSVARMNAYSNVLLVSLYFQRTTDARSLVCLVPLHETEICMILNAR